MKTLVRTFFAAFGVGFGVASALAGLTEEQASDRFDLALRGSDGALLKTVFRSREVQGVSAESLTRFMELVVEPVWAGPSLQRRADGSAISWSSPDCQMMIAFQANGSFRPTIVSERTRFFTSPLIREGEGFKVRASMAQIMFAFAYLKTHSPGRSRLESARRAQTQFEEWAQKMKKLKIAGSIDPEKGTWKTWDQIIKDSRAEIRKIAGG